MKVKNIKLKWSVLTQIIWPTLEGKPENPEEIDISWINKELQQEEDLAKISKLYDTSCTIADAERKRYEVTTNKTIALLGSTGIIITITFSLSSFLNISGFQRYVLLFGYVVVLTYFLRLIFFCLAILITEKFYTLGPKELCNLKNKDQLQYLKHLAGKLLEFTEKNYRITNEKISLYILTLKYFMLVIVAIIILGILTVFIH